MNAIFIGITNGVITPVAIMREFGGRLLMSGIASRS